MMKRLCDLSMGDVFILPMHGWRLRVHGRNNDRSMMWVSNKFGNRFLLSLHITVRLLPRKRIGANL